MSTDSTRDRGPDSEAVLEQFQRWYHVPALVLVVGYMLWIRVQPLDNYRSGDQVFFDGNDAYYHLRATRYSIENWPRRLYGDPYTQFPYGSDVGQFGTLFDQIVATVALIVGLGDPSAEQVELIALLTPAVLGALVAIPTYLLARRLTGRRIGGVVAAVLIGLIPQGIWISRSTVGFFDHHVAETLLMTIAVFAMVVALGVVRRERPVFEQFQDRDWNGLRDSVVYSALAGLALAVYVLVWPSAIVLLGIFGVYFVVAASLAVVQDRSPEHLLIAGGVSMIVAGAITLPFVQTTAFEVTELGLLHVLAPLSVVAGCAFLGWLARYWDRNGHAAAGYPGAVAGVGLVAVAVAWLVLPEAVDTVWSNMQRIFFLGQTDTTLTISEAQSMTEDDTGLAQQFYDGYGFGFFTAVIALVAMAAYAVFSSRPRPGELLIVVWSTFLVLMALTQVRFHYYLVVAVAVLNAWLVVQALDLFSFPSLSELGEIETYHVIVVALVVVVLIVPVAFAPVATYTANEVADAQGPGAEIQYWNGNLAFMEENTPVPGTYGDAEEPMAPYDQFDDVGGDYEYPGGAYGVMSWWDYGHWITTEGERIPNANPFQQGPRAASAFFQESDEERATAYLEALPAREGIGGSLWGMEDDELQSVVDDRTDQQAGEETRYVMIDDLMAGGKFSPITEWTGPDFGNYVDNELVQTGEGERSLPTTNDRYEETMLSKLYLDDANGLEQYRLVHESQLYSVVGSRLVQGPQGNQRSIPLTNDLAGASQAQAQLAAAQAGYFNAQIEPSVKTFERVEGATITGTAEPGQNVTAAVQLETNANRAFEYSQTVTAGDDGSFEVTVPYATTEELGPADGYTESDVLANGTYTVYATDDGNATAADEDVTVPEETIYDGGEVGVDLGDVDEDWTLPWAETGDDQNVTDGEGSVGDGGDGTDGNETAGNETGGDGDDAQSALEPTAATPIERTAA